MSDLFGKVLFLDRSHPLLKERLLAMGFACEEDFFVSGTDLENRIGDYAGIVLRSRISIGRDLIGRAKNLRLSQLQNTPALAGVFASGALRVSPCT